jgi:hypothetical protein
MPLREPVLHNVLQSDEDILILETLTRAFRIAWNIQRT